MKEPKIFSTAEWRAQAVSSSFTKKLAKGIVVHNTQTSNRTPKRGSAEQ